MFWRIAGFLHALQSLDQHLKHYGGLLIKNVERVPDALANEYCYPCLAIPNRQIDVAVQLFSAYHNP